MLRIFPIVALISFILTWILVYFFIKFADRVGISGVDQHKRDKPIVPTSVGMPVFLGVFASLMFFVFVRTFFYKDTSNTLYVFAATSSLFLITFIGFLDDLLVKKKRFGEDSMIRAGLKRRHKIFLVLPAAIPLMVIMAGVTEVYIPFFGNVQFGLLYPLALIPLGVLGAANMINMFGGLNGLEVGMGMIYTGMLGLYAFVNGRDVATVIALSAFGALLAARHFNKVPAKILAGDSIQYFLGAVLVVVAVLGNIEKAAAICAIPFFLEAIIKLRGKLRKTTVGYINERGYLQSKYKKIYSIPHIFMRRGIYTEKEIVNFLLLFEFVCASLIWFI